MKNRSVVCNINKLFDVLHEDLENKLCTTIEFKLKGKKHLFGSYGDNGETKKNVRYYLDKLEYDNLKDFESNISIYGIKLKNSEIKVEVVECNGCYPSDTPILITQ